MTETQGWILILLALLWLADHASVQANRHTVSSWQFAAGIYALLGAVVFAKLAYSALT